MGDARIFANLYPLVLLSLVATTVRESLPLPDDLLIVSQSGTRFSINSDQAKFDLIAIVALEPCLFSTFKVALSNLRKSPFS